MRPQTTTQPAKPRPTGAENDAALATLAACIAWEEWDKEPNRVIEDVCSYQDGLMDLINDREMGAPEISYLVLGLLGIQEYPDEQETE